MGLPRAGRPDSVGWWMQRSAATAFFTVKFLRAILCYDV
ncbi:hypothetical protein THTE_1891 [Thermogutta terrifontis]|uniref:Uncharacterized protein n=1 Tax=Thermogutta terrifontis TaxID=1331910 RepID=A0A286REW8_9BACT|nr:hypothetical protein THTE_1891 [Thermogutta terrifontis]